MRLLFADDETELLKALKAVFERNGFVCDTADNGGDALEYGMSGIYDGIILDIMMPVMDGVEVLKALRAGGIDTPVMMLTAKGEIEDRVLGLDMGADDYLPKPFAVAELLARVRAMLRRRGELVPDTLAFADLLLDRSAFTLKCGNESTRIIGREFQMIELLMNNPRRIVSTSQFMDRIWGWDSEADVSVVWVYVSNIRKKLAKLGTRAVIKTTPSVGYSLIDPEERSCK